MDWTVICHPVHIFHCTFWSLNTADDSDEMRLMVVRPNSLLTWSIFSPTSLTLCNSSACRTTSATRTIISNISLKADGTQRRQLDFDVSGTAFSPIVSVPMLITNNRDQSVVVTATNIPYIPSLWTFFTLNLLTIKTETYQFFKCFFYLMKNFD